MDLLSRINPNVGINVNRQHIDFDAQARAQTDAAINQHAMMTGDTTALDRQFVLEQFDSNVKMQKIGLVLIWFIVVIAMIQYGLPESNAQLFGQVTWGLGVSFALYILVRSQYWNWIGSWSWPKARIEVARKAFTKTA